MKQIKLILFVGFCLVVQFLFAQDINFTTNLPIVFLDTKGATILDDPRIRADMGIVWNEDGSDNSTSDAYNHYNGTVSIEIRGSSSQHLFEKKSFGFELKDELDQDMDFPLLGMPEEEDWILYAPYSDKTCIRNVLTFSLADKISDVYTPRCRFVELFINKKYEGLYVLMEKIKRDSVRVDIAKLRTEDISGKELTGGYIVKVDKLTGSGGDGWYSDYYNAKSTKTYYQYEYPKAENIQEPQKEYIQSYIKDFETSLYNKDFHPERGYSAYIHPESFMDYIIMNELAKNVDGYRLSTFLYKEKNGKLHAGPIWDFNLGYGNADYYKGWETHGLQLYADLENDGWQNPFWWNNMLLDSYFSHELRCRWDSLRQYDLATHKVNMLVDSLVDHISDATVRNFERWPVIGTRVWPNKFVEPTYWQEVYWLKDWIEDRLNWLDFALPGDCETEPEYMPPVTEDNIEIYPNPFTTNLNLQVISRSSLSYRIQLFKVNGQKVFEKSYVIAQGLNSINIPTNELEGGVYIYRIYKGNTEVAVSKLVKVTLD